MTQVVSPPVVFQSVELEQAWLARVISDDLSFASISSVPNEWFTQQDNLDLVEALRLYYRTYHRRPSTSVAFQSFLDRQFFAKAGNLGTTYLFCEMVANPSEDLEVISAGLKDLAAKRFIDKTVFGTAREGLLLGKPGAELIQELSQVFFTRQMGAATDDGSQRGFVWTDAVDRIKIYEEIKARKTSLLGIPFGMSYLDEIFGGIRKKFIQLVYGNTGIGKSKFLLNVAMNAASLDFVTMYISLEMSWDNVLACVDSRYAFLDFYGIERGKLAEIQEDAYRTSLSELQQKQLPLYICDIPGNITPMDVVAELQRFEMENQRKIDLVVLDYANLMSPAKKMPAGSNESQTYDQLFQELHFQVAKRHNVGLLTAVQESRQNKNKDSGVKNIGKSHYIASHCHGIIHLHQSPEERIQNIIKATIDKNRFGPALETFDLSCVFPLNYIGDETLPTSLLPQSSWVGVPRTSPTGGALQNPNEGEW